jgi:hypothetical protein
MVAIATHRQTDCGDLGLFDETAAVLTETTIERAQNRKAWILGFSFSERLEDCILPSKGPQVPAADARSKSAYRSQSGLRTAQGPVSPSCPRKVRVARETRRRTQNGTKLDAVLYWKCEQRFTHAAFDKWVLAPEEHPVSNADL